MKYGKLLREARKAAGVTQVELAKRLGRPSQSLCRVEAGSRQPMGIVDTIKAASYLGADPAPLLRACLISIGAESEAFHAWPGEQVDRLVRIVIEATGGQNRSDSERNRSV